MKTFVIAQTTFIELSRRPLFWMLTAITAILLWVFDFIPYYTLGEDIKMVKDQGLIVIMVTGLIIALFSASVSIADEIEGKTAMTLLSKPVSRRSFIVGKYLGIMAAILMMFVILGICFYLALYYKEFYEARENSKERPTHGVALWQQLGIIPGVVLAYFQVCIMCALSVAFSTRFPLHLNLTACIGIFMLGHLAPMMSDIAVQNNVYKGVGFMAQIFETIFPKQTYFSIGPAISTDVDVPWVGYVLPAFVYCILYTSIALHLALLMFEDRDLA